MGIGESPDQSGVAADRLLTSLQRVRKRFAELALHLINVLQRSAHQGPRRTLQGLLLGLGLLGGIAGAFTLAQVDDRDGGRPPPLHVASFNIENFARSDAQSEEVFRLLREIDAALVAVQEIRNPRRFRSDARERLGRSYDFVFANAGHAQRVGVLYDRRRLRLESHHIHRETLIGRRAKPLLEARFTQLGSGQRLTVFVLHLTSGAHRVQRRRAQLESVRDIVAAAVREGQNVVVAGDFNSSSERDRTTIERWASAIGVGWTTAGLECTAYWRRSDECPGSALDHLLTNLEASDVSVHGACASVGCRPGAECPSYYYRVSDHCPLSMKVRRP